MSHANPDLTSWVYVIIQDPGGNEQFVGLEDEKTNMSYIPAFSSKEDAQACLIHLPLPRGKKYEIQAIILEDLAADASENDFLIFMLDGGGKIANKINPNTI